MKALAVWGLVAAVLVLHLVAGLVVAVCVVGWEAGVRMAERAA